MQMLMFATTFIDTPAHVGAVPVRTFHCRDLRYYITASVNLKRKFPLNNGAIISSTLLSLETSNAVRFTYYMATQKVKVALLPWTSSQESLKIFFSIFVTISSFKLCQKFITIFITLSYNRTYLFF